MTDENTYRQTVIAETQRVRTVIGFVGRRVHSLSFKLGQWRIPSGTTILVAFVHVHGRSQEYPADPRLFRPEAFIGERSAIIWMAPIQCEARRCLREVFATVEIATVIQTFAIDPPKRGTRSSTAVGSPSTQRTAPASSRNG
jgi:cytochrome P450